MKPCRFLFCIILALSLSLPFASQGQNLVQKQKNEKEFKLFADFSKEHLDINFSIPSGFSITQYCTFDFWLPLLCSGNETDGAKKFFDINSTGLPQGCGQILLSNDGNCMLMYPMLGEVAIGQRDGRSEKDIYDELLAHYRECMPSSFNPTNSTFRMLSQMVTTNTGKSAKAFNADAIRIVPLPLKESYLGKFSQCIGVYLYKKGHTPIHLKVLMTDSSKNNSLDYIKLLSKHVKYGSKKEIASFDETTRQAWQSYLQNVKNLENQ